MVSKGSKKRGKEAVFRFFTWQKRGYDDGKRSRGQPPLGKFIAFITGLQPTAQRYGISLHQLRHKSPSRSDGSGANSKKCVECRMARIVGKNVSWGRGMENRNLEGRRLPDSNMR